jgi:hypothetical protein
MKSSDLEQRERQKFIGSTTTQTYHSRSLADLALELAQGGRHAKPASVIGSEPTIRYPANLKARHGRSILFLTKNHLALILIRRK